MCSCSRSRGAAPILWAFSPQFIHLGTPTSTHESTQTHTEQWVAMPAATIPHGAAKRGGWNMPRVGRGASSLGEGAIWHDSYRAALLGYGQGLRLVDLGLAALLVCLGARGTRGGEEVEELGPVSDVDGAAGE